MEPGLTRAQKSLIRSLATRHGRRKSGLALCEGVRACRELAANLPGSIEFFAVTGEMLSRLDVRLPAPVVEVSEAEYASLSTVVSPPGILAVLKPPAAASAAPQDPFILALDRVADPGNFGTMLRTARAAGLRDVWYTDGSADPWSEKVIRSALGAHFSMRLRPFASLDELRRAGAQAGYGRVWISDPHGGDNCFTAPGLFEKSVVVIGNEANGVSPEESGGRVTIPMPGGFESLNAAQAATVLIFEFVRRQTVKG